MAKERKEKKRNNSSRTRRTFKRDYNVIIK